jgi:hypothetical protein
MAIVKRVDTIELYLQFNHNHDERASKWIITGIIKTKTRIFSTNAQKFRIKAEWLIRVPENYSDNHLNFVLLIVSLYLIHLYIIIA